MVRSIVAGLPERAVGLPAVIAACAKAGVAWQRLAVFHAPSSEPVQAQGGKGRVFPDFTFGAHAAEVEVDLDTGQVRVLGTPPATMSAGRSTRSRSRGRSRARSLRASAAR